MAGRQTWSHGWRTAHTHCLLRFSFPVRPREIGAGQGRSSRADRLGLWQPAQLRLRRTAIRHTRDPNFPCCKQGWTSGLPALGSWSAAVPGGGAPDGPRAPDWRQVACHPLPAMKRAGYLGGLRSRMQWRVFAVGGGWRICYMRIYMVVEVW